MPTDDSTEWHIVPFRSADWPEARRLLLHGYPCTPAAWWDAGWRRLRAVPPAAADEPMGVFLHQGRQPRGVALMFPSQRPGSGGTRWQVSASSWSIEPTFRDRALWMARHTMNEPGRTYTALTSITSARRMLQRIGFKPVSHQCVLGFTPRLQASARAGTRVLHGEAALAALRDHPLAAALADHHRLQCVVLALETASGLVPLVFRPQRRLRWVPTAELLYAPSQAVVAAHVGDLARALLRRGYLLLAFEAQEDLAIDFPATRLFQRRFALGPYPAQGVDHLYSELVYLHR